jgi:hypothetical protein
MSEVVPWGRQAFVGALDDLSPAPEPALTRSPLEQEVLDLSAGVVGRGEDPTAGVANMNLSWFTHVGCSVVDAVLARDKRALDLLDGLLRQQHRLLAIAEREWPQDAERRTKLEAVVRAKAWLQLAMEFIRSAADRVAPAAFAAEVAGTHRERFLRIVAKCPGINSRGIREQMQAHRAATAGAERDAPMSEAQLSKIGKRLRNDRLVTASRGRSGLSWELTPAGELVVDHLLAADPRAEQTGRHVVDSMVIAAGASASTELAEALSATEPREVTVVRNEEYVTYERRDSSARAPLPRPEPIPFTVAAHELLEEEAPSAAAPAVFALSNGVVYQQVSQG